MNEQYGLTVENLLNVLPDVLRQDEKMLALATGVAEILTARPAEIEQNMLYQHIDTLPEARHVPRVLARSPSPRHEVRR